MTHGEVAARDRGRPRVVQRQRAAELFTANAGPCELDTTSREARMCEIASHNWVHAGGVREGDVFVQRQHCDRRCGSTSSTVSC
jgi:hypothetical protein